jgi:hypothetical protein
MAEIVRPVDLESQVVVCVDHLVSHGVLQMTLVLHLIRAQQNAKFRIESTGLSTRASTAVDVVTVKIASKLADVIAEKSDNGACKNEQSVSPFQPSSTKISSLTVLKQVITLVLAALAIRRFISQVSRNAELLNALGGHLPRQDPVDIAELGERVISRNISSLRLVIRRCSRTWRLRIGHLGLAVSKEARRSRRRNSDGRRKPAETAEDAPMQAG